MPALDRPALLVASELLGVVLVVSSAEGHVGVRISEVEAYEGLADPASHAFRGRTPRTEVMFGPAGRLYVYFSYGMHHAVNIVCGQDGTASACLLRAGAVVEGAGLASLRRGDIPAARLASGPGNLGRALGLTVADSGVVLGGARAWLTPGEPVEAGMIRCGPRVGVSRAAEVPWRFWVADDPTVSAYRRSPRA